jgi:hypothetical protein
MEPIRHTLTARLKYLKMYREDLDQLVAIFVRDCKTVTISDSKYRYDSLDEMKQKVGPKVKDIDIRGENPGVRFLFNQTEITRIGNPPLQAVYNELRTEEISDTADGVFYKIKDLVTKYERPTFVKGWVLPLVIGSVGMFWFIIHNSYKNASGQFVLGSWPGFVVFLLLFATSLVYGISPSNYLSLESRRNSASFFIRNREEFAKHAVTATISTVIGGLAGYIIGHYLK